MGAVPKVFAISVPYPSLIGMCKGSGMELHQSLLGLLARVRYTMTSGQLKELWRRRKPCSAGWQLHAETVAWRSSHNVLVDGVWGC